MADSNNRSSGGISFVGALTILFIGLKLTNYIQWPWLWVLSPIWISLGIALILYLIAGILWFIAKILSK